MSQASKLACWAGVMRAGGSIAAVAVGAAGGVAGAVRRSRRAGGRRGAGLEASSVRDALRGQRRSTP